MAVNAEPKSELSPSPSRKAILCYGPCGTFFGTVHVDEDTLRGDNDFEVRCRNGRCRRDGYVTYHRWDLALGGCTTRHVPKQYEDVRDDPDVLRLVKGPSHVDG